MSRYKINKAVNWRSILRVLHWYLSMRVSQYHQDCSHSDKEHMLLAQFDKGLIQKAYSNYHQLRNFLGINYKTKIELEVLEILNENNQDREAQ